MQTHGSTSSGPGSSSPENNRETRRQDEPQQSIFRVEGLSCRHTAAELAQYLRKLSGVLNASVCFTSETIYVRYDRRCLSERELVLKMAHRGIWLYPSFGETNQRSSVSAARLGAVVALLANVIGLALWPSARNAPRLPWVELMFAVLMIVVAVPPILTRVFRMPRRSGWRAEVMALVAAGLALAIGLLSMFVHAEIIPLTPNFLLRAGRRIGGAGALAFESTTAILGLVFLGNEVRQYLLRQTFANMDQAIRHRYARVRRVLPHGGDEFVPCLMVCRDDRLRLVTGEVAKLDLRLDGSARIVGGSGCVEERSSGQTMFRGERLVSAAVTGHVEHVPRADAAVADDAHILRELQRIEHHALDTTERRLENIVTLALNLATLWFAALALLIHALTGRHALHAGVGLAATAVLAGSAPTALASSFALMRIVAVMRARSMGFVIQNISGLEALASIDVALFDLSGRVYLDAPTAVRGLWHRAIACRLLSEESDEVASVLQHRYGMAASGRLDGEDKRHIVTELRRAGARVLFVGEPDTAQMLPVDVSIAVAPDTLPVSTRAPIICRNARLTALVWLVDLARELRRRKRMLPALTILYEVCVVPLCTAGLLSPLAAAGLSFGLMVATSYVAYRVGSRASASFNQDKQLWGQIGPFSVVPPARRGS